MKQLPLRIPKPKTEVINLKVSEEDLKVMRALAKKYAAGNLSLWIRHAALNYKAEAPSS